MNKKLKVTLLQSYLFWEDPKKNLRQFESKIDSLNQSTDLIVLPEMFNTGYTTNASLLSEAVDGMTVDWMRRIASKKASVVTGSLMVKEDGKYFNRLIWMLPDGSFSHYDKRHLFGLSKEKEVFTPGHEKLVVELKGFNIRPMICYDLRFPVWCRNKGGAYDIMIFVASWPEKRISNWKTLLGARAVENQCYVIGVNRVGDDANNVYHSGETMLIHPGGNILFQKSDEEDMYTAILSSEEVTKTRKSLPFLEDADDFEVSL